jgi:hypothetical protein
MDVMACQKILGLAAMLISGVNPGRYKLKLIVQSTQKIQVPLHLMDIPATGNLSAEGKRTGAGPESHSPRDPGHSHQQSTAQGAVRDQGQVEPAIPQPPGHPPKTRKSPVTASLVINHEAIYGGVTRQNFGGSRNDQNPNLALREGIFSRLDQGQGQDQIA